MLLRIVYDDMGLLPPSTDVWNVAIVVACRHQHGYEVGVNNRGEKLRAWRCTILRANQIIQCSLYDVDKGKSWSELSREV